MALTSAGRVRLCDRGWRRRLCFGAEVRADAGHGMNFACISETVSSKSSHVAQSRYSVIGDKPFLWSKPKFDHP